MNEDRTGLTAWALACYRQPGAMPSLLALQDEFGLDVLLLLTTAWLWTLGRSLPAAQLHTLEELHAPWQDKVVIPLREVRRQLKQDIQAQVLYQQVKALELEAELLQLERLQGPAMALSVAQASELMDQFGVLVAHETNAAHSDQRLQNLLAQFAAAVAGFTPAE